VSSVILNAWPIQRPVFRKYDKYAYCKHCGKWIPKEELKTDKAGRKRCPKCGRLVRVKYARVRQRARIRAMLKRGKAVRCMFCGERFTDWVEFSRHIKYEHGLEW